MNGRFRLRENGEKLKKRRKIKKILSNFFYYVTIILLTFYGDVAQLARASGSYPEGRGFDSLRRYQL